MKRVAFLLALVVSAPVALEAGAFGPPPFSNGSPLITGVDGSYQASARATNVTGVFRFRYANGAQTSSTSQNSWVFFINGQVQRGSVVANINNSSLDGILDSLSAGTTTNTNGTVALPIVFLNANNSSAGTFQGKMNQNSPSGAFSGQGTILPAPASTNQVIGITTNALGFDVTTTSYTNIAGSIPPTGFRFRGVRTTTIASTSTN